MESHYSESAPVKVRLLQGPIYAEDAALWKLLIAHQEKITADMHDLGQELIIEPQEGWAYLEQKSVSSHPSMLQLFKRRPLSFETTLLLVILRAELLRLDSTPRAVESLPTVKQSWLLEELAAFVPEQNNSVRRENALKAVIKQGVAMGVIRPLDEDAEDGVYQIMRIVKAKLPESRISEIKERLKAATPEAPNDDAKN